MAHRGPVILFRALLGAAALASMAPALANAAEPAFIPFAGPAEAPRGFLDMCQRNRDFCAEGATSGGRVMATGGLAARPGAPKAMPATRPIDADVDPLRPVPAISWQVGPAAPPPIVLTDDEAGKLLNRVNRLVNSRVRQQTDMQLLGRGEIWRRSGIERGAAGDCEDLAIEKRYQLIDAGFPRDNLAFAVVYSAATELHTVLIARTGEGDFVLDSRSPFVRPWSRAPYSWISVQMMGDPMSWRSVRG